MDGVWFGYLTVTYMQWWWCGLQGQFQHFQQFSYWWTHIPNYLNKKLTYHSPPKPLHNYQMGEPAELKMETKQEDNTPKFAFLQSLSIFPSALPILFVDLLQWSSINRKK